MTKRAPKNYLQGLKQRLNPTSVDNELAKHLWERIQENVPRIAVMNDYYEPWNMKPFNPEEALNDAAFISSIESKLAPTSKGRYRKWIVTPHLKYRGPDKLPPHAEAVEADPQMYVDDKDPFISSYAKKLLSGEIEPGHGYSIELIAPTGSAKSAYGGYTGKLAKRKAIKEDPRFKDIPIGNLDATEISWPDKPRDYSRTLSDQDLINYALAQNKFDISTSRPFKRGDETAEYIKSQCLDNPVGKSFDPHYMNRIMPTYGNVDSRRGNCDDWMQWVKQYEENKRKFLEAFGTPSDEEIMLDPQMYLESLMPSVRDRANKLINGED